MKLKKGLYVTRNDEIGFWRTRYVSDHSENVVIIEGTEELDLLSRKVISRAKLVPTPLQEGDKVMWNGGDFYEVIQLYHDLFFDTYYVRCRHLYTNDIEVMHYNTFLNNIKQLSE